jgi:hypothetical protein
MDAGTIYLASGAAARLRSQQRAFRVRQLAATWACGLVLAAPWLGLLAWMEWPR